MTSRMETMDSVVIDRARLGLIEWNAVCLIEYEGAIHAIGLAAGTMPIPSAWSGHGTHGPSSCEQGFVVLVAGPLAHPDDYLRSGHLSPSDRCSHMARGVIAREGLSVVSDSLGYCAEIAPEEKFYYGIVHANAE